MITLMTNTTIGLACAPSDKEIIKKHQSQIKIISNKIFKTMVIATTIHNLIKQFFSCISVNRVLICHKIRRFFFTVIYFDLIFPSQENFLKNDWKLISILAILLRLVHIHPCCYMLGIKPSVQPTKAIREQVRNNQNHPIFAVIVGIKTRAPLRQPMNWIKYSVLLSATSEVLRNRLHILKGNFSIKNPQKKVLKAFRSAANEPTRDKNLSSLKNVWPNVL
ncbi:hypothetical protein BpHYR1_043451 [Brachionus plicatilis]|uniref:RNA-directed DNA polymerase from mobile element jockey-like n=1 Tax=Brachionus plicatilis TaxID=10195 RepID=A0A3M7RNF1_BRAPC|nr:hypothetical protein BpHYR1_043451 [Brachionus plicatilis]